MSDKQFGWALSAFALGYALCQTPAGMLADRFGPRLILTIVVTAWSLFTGLTGAATGLASLLVVRFLFGAGEAGAFPGMARAIYSWIPMTERGIAQGINFSGGRLGAAFALPAVAWLVETLGWRQAFAVLMLIGFVWAAAWFVWFRDDPADDPRLSDAERELILSFSSASDRRPGSRAAALGKERCSASTNLWLLMLQYFFQQLHLLLLPELAVSAFEENVSARLGGCRLVCLGPARLPAPWDNSTQAGWSIASIAAAAGRPRGSLPAVLGFVLAAGGLLASLSAESAIGAVAWLSVAIFGADMTISPSWAVCIDIGGRHSGAVSGTMNMAGNLGSFVTALGVSVPVGVDRQRERILHHGRRAEPPGRRRLAVRAAGAAIRVSSMSQS